MTKKTWKFNLSSAGIDTCVETIQDIAKEHLDGAPQSGTIAFSMELILLNFQKYFGEDKFFELEFVKRFKKVDLYIKLKGDNYDPRMNAQANDEDDEFSSIILNRYSEDATDFRYQQGINIVHRSVKQKPKMSSGLKILIGLVLGVIFGLLGQMFSAPTQESVALLLSTINGIILDLIVMGATLVVFMMVVNSISGFGNIATVKKTGACIIKQYLLSFLIGTIVFVAYILLVFDFSFAGGDGAGGAILSIFTETLAGIFPESSLSPFIDCDFLQIIFLAVMIGIAMIFIGDKTRTVREFGESFELIANQVLEWFCGLLPLFVFTMIPSLIWDGQLAAMAQAIMQLVGITVTSSVVFAVRLVLMCRALKVGPLKALKILKPAMLRGLITASSTASITQIQDAIRGLKVKESFNSFATAMGLIFDAVSSYLSYMILTFYLLYVSGMQISVSTIISLVIICLLLSIASPPVSGGAIAIEFIIAEMLNVPDAYLAVVPAIMLVSDFIATSQRCGGIAVTAAMSAKLMNEIEE